MGPTITEDNIEIEEPSMTECIFHFLMITWNVLFACVPPVHWGGGYPAFVVALVFIGVITAIVGDAATALGCVMPC